MHPALLIAIGLAMSLIPYAIGLAVGRATCHHYEQRRLEMR